MAASSISTVPRPDPALDLLFAPRSVAIIGASEDGSRIGGRPIRYLIEGGFRGAIYPINPKRDTVQGLKAWASLDDVPEDVDVAVIVLPADAVEAAIEQCARRSVRIAIVFSAGFGETGEAGRALQQRLLDTAARHRIRLLGPNCLGAFNAGSGFFGTFTQALDGGVAQPGPVAIASQSGAYGAHVYCLCTERGLKMQYWVATGNEGDIDIGDCVLWLAHRPEVKVIVVYIEAVRDGAKFVAGLIAARAARKPVVVHKVGRSAAGAHAAASHTGALSGEDAVIDAVLKQYGAYRATSTENLVDIAYACSRGIFPTGRDIALLTLSGGVGIQMADACEEHGLNVRTMSEEGQKKITDLVSFAAPANPIDLTAQVINDGTLVSSAIDVVLHDGRYDALLFFLSTMPTVERLRLLLDGVLSAKRGTFAERLLVLSFIGPADVRRKYEDWGYLFFEDVNRAVTAIAALVQFGESFDRAAREPVFVPRALPALPPGEFDEHLAKRVLAEAGVPSLQEHVVATPELAAEAAAKIGAPVVLKIVSPDIQHKTEVGGVLLNLATPDEVRAAAQLMGSSVAARMPSARLDGFLVAPMCPKGIETICGVVRDPVFGPIVMFGLGGIFVEVLKDVVFRHAPFSVDEARRMVAQIKGHALLQGARGAKPADVELLAVVLSRLSEFAVRHQREVAEIDINPFVVFDAGKGGAALDALIVRSPME